MTAPAAIRRLAQGALRKAGYELVPVRSSPLSGRRGINLDILDLAVSDLLRKRSTLRFLQVGAFDGKSNDAVYPLVAKYPLSGVLVEPQAGPFAALQENYRELAPRRSLIFLNCAIGPHDGTIALYTVRPGSPCPAYLAQAASFDRQHLLRCGRRVPNFASMIEERQVRSLTFDTLFQETGLEHVDLLHVDAEGYDAEILRLFDIPKRLPAIVRFEWGHLSPRDHAACVALLADHGYRINVGDMDTLAYRAD